MTGRTGSNAAAIGGFTTLVLAICLVAPLEGQDVPWAVHGRIVNVEGAREGWVVFDRAGVAGIVAAEDQLPAGARKIQHAGYIFPGLIDAHNHAHWNALPQWRAGRRFNSRYEWLDDREYRAKVSGLFYGRVRDAKLEYAALKYAEVRAVLGGVTLLQSSYTAVEPTWLVRNLDTSYHSDSRIPDITQITREELHRFRTGLASGRTRRIFLHVGEGKAADTKCAQEFAFLESQGLARPGVVVIHGIALGPREFQQMAAQGMYLVWSPQSNFVLYGETANVTAALKAGVPVALAPDWTITGSDNVLEELKVAWRHSQESLQEKLTAQQLFRMATVDAARAAGVEERLGSLRFGTAADMFLAPELDADPFVSLLKTYPRHIQLVFIGGEPVYGDRTRLRELLPDALLDELEVEGASKAIHLVGDPGASWHAQQRFPELIDTLKRALPTLAPLIEPDAP